MTCAADPPCGDSGVAFGPMHRANSFIKSRQLAVDCQMIALQPFAEPLTCPLKRLADL
jgi:hypothetical protein